MIDDGRRTIHRQWSAVVAQGETLLVRMEDATQQACTEGSRSVERLSLQDASRFESLLIDSFGE